MSRATLNEGSFQGKINALIQVHVAHQEELQAVADRLSGTARSYGYSETEIEVNLRRATERQ